VPSPPPPFFFLLPPFSPSPSLPPSFPPSLPPSLPTFLSPPPSLLLFLCVYICIHMNWFECPPPYSVPSPPPLSIGLPTNGGGAPLDPTDLRATRVEKERGVREGEREREREKERSTPKGALTTHPTPVSSTPRRVSQELLHGPGNTPCRPFNSFKLALRFIEASLSHSFIAVTEAK
jgi:hypothetical protein